MLTLEAQLTALTQDFVARLVDALRNASLADVAALSLPRLSPASQPTPRTARRSPALPPAPAPAHVPARAAGGGRQTAAVRAQLGERVLEALRAAAEPMGVRALSDELGVAPDVLGAPLRELRAAGKIRKNGEKRSTTYST